LLVLFHDKQLKQYVLHDLAHRFMFSARVSKWLPVQAA
jgi:hypothetical protein